MSPSRRLLLQALALLVAIGVGFLLLARVLDDRDVTTRTAAQDTLGPLQQDVPGESP